MTSEVSICNIALSRIGTKSNITSLGEDSNEARSCALVYENIRDTLLRAYPWGFATRRVALADLGSPPPGYDYKYAYPSDCLKLQGIYKSARGGDPIHFDIGNDLDPDGNARRVILTNSPEAVIIYTVRVTDPTLFSQEFITAFSWALAADIAMPITGKMDIANRCAQLAQITLTQARVTDANERVNIHRHTPEWLSVREYTEDSSEAY